MSNTDSKRFDEELAARARAFDERERQRVARKVERYDALADWRLERLATRHYYSEQVRRLMGSLVTASSRVLEVGCGLGDLLASLGASEAVGIDIAPRMIELGRQRHPELALRVADVERDPLPEGPFDVILLSDVVGHLDDIQRALERLRALLASGGRMVVGYYSYAWEPLLKLAEAVGLKTPWPEQNWLSMTDLANLLELSDLEVVRRGTDVLLPLRVPLVSELANRVVAKMPLTRAAPPACPRRSRACR